MGKLAKIILILFSTILVLLLAAVVIIPFVVDLNDYKPEIEAAVKDKTGRTLSIEGDLNVSIFPWIGVSTGRISLSNAPGFKEQSFAILGESDIKVKLVPLFSKKLEVRAVVVKGLQLHLAKNEQGISNWSDLVKPQDTKDQQQNENIKKEEDTTAAYIDSYNIGGLVLENSQLSWNDQSSGQHVVIKDFNLHTGAIAFNEPIDVKLSLLLESSDPAVTEQLSFSTNLLVDDALQKIQLSNLNLNSVTKGESIPGGILDTQLESEVALDLQEQTLALKGVQLYTNFINLKGNLNATQLDTELQYKGTIKDASFRPKELLQQLQMTVPETADQQVLQKFVMNFDVQGSKDSLALDNLNITLDDTQIKGYTRITQFKNPALEFKLVIDDIDIDRYSPPKQAPPVATPTAAVAAVTTLIPVETLRKLNLSGVLRIEKLKIAQLKMAGVSLNVQAKQGKLRTRQSVKTLYDGSYKGQMTIDAKPKTPTLTFDEKISGLAIEPLLNDLQPDTSAKLKGTANIAAKLKAHGNTMPAIKSTLDGKLSFSLHKGAIRDFNLQQIIDLGKLAVKGKEMNKSYANEQTVFTLIKGTATIKKGLMNNPDFLAESSTVEVKGKGTANLVNETLDYKLVAKAKKGGKNVAKRPVAIKVQGTLSEPIYTVDLSSIESMLTPKEKQEVDKFIDKREKDIDKALGKDSGKKVKKLLKGFF